MHGRQDAGNLDADQVIVGAGEIEIDGVNIGYTQEGVTFSYEREIYDVEADQAMSSIMQKKSKEVLTISTTLLESTLANLKLVWDICGTVQAGVGTSQICFGGHSWVGEHGLWFSGPGPNNHTRYIEVYKVVSVESGEHAFTRDGATVIPVVFQAREDVTKPKGQRLGCIIDTDDEWEVACV